jgi:amidohydrolase
MLDGSIRGYNNQAMDKVCERITEIVESVCKMFGCSFHIDFYEKYPAVINHPEQSQIVSDVFKQAIGSDFVSPNNLPISASEDFAMFLTEKPGCFFFLGGGKESEPK